MGSLYNLKSLRSGYSIFSCSFAFRPKILVLGDLKPSPLWPQNQLLYRPITTEISENQHNFTVNYLVKSCGLSPEGAISASKWVELQSSEKADSVLAFLRNHGFSQTQISKLVRSHTGLLSADPEKTILPKLEFFSSIGISREDVAKTLANTPQLLARSLEKKIIPTYNFLRSLVSEKNAASVFKWRSRIFLEELSKNVEPNMSILRELGMPQSCISLLLAHHTHTLMRRPEKFGEVVDEVKKLGFNLEKSTSVNAIHAVCSYKSIWNQNCEVYRRWGWSEDDVLSAFRRYPQCMMMSEKKLMQVMDILVKKVGWSSRMIVKFPVVMCLSLEKRIIPRCLVVKVLSLKGLVSVENLSMGRVFQPVESKFLKSFVTRYLDQVPQLESVYQGNVGIQDV